MKYPGDDQPFDWEIDELEEPEEEDPRERGDDDGREYADPRDALDGLDR